MTRKKARTAIDGAAGATRGRPAFVRAPLRVVLAVVLGAAAAVRAADRIEDAELAGAMRELDYSLREQKTLERPLHDVVSRYREQLQRARTAREAAIAHFLLAAALERAGSRDASVGQLQLAVGEFDAFPLAHMTLGKLYMDEGNLDRARDCFARCREVDPERVEATVALAVTGLREGTAEGAEEARALLEPLYVRRDVPDVASWLAMAHLRRAQASPDPVEARAALERAWTLAVEGLREAPERDNARAAFATALRALDDDPDRVPRFATVMRSLPPGPAPYLTVASVAAVFRSTGRAARAGFWLNVALTSHAALREPDALESSLAAAVGDEGLRAVAIDAARACRERFLDAHRPIALRRGDAHLLGAVYLPWLGRYAGEHADASEEARRVFGALFRQLAGDDPALIGEGLRVAIRMEDERAYPILASVAEREWSTGISPPNAVLAARALAATGGKAALPALLRALACPAPALRAEAHAQLGRLTGTLDPLQPREAPPDAADHWRRYFRDVRGAGDLRDGLEKLARLVPPGSATVPLTPLNRPTLYHLVTQVLEDAQLSPELWNAAWAVVVIEAGADLREESRRGAPIDEDERRALVAELKTRLGVADGG